MRWGTTIPALPARDVAAATRFDVERLGCTVRHTDGSFRVPARDDLDARPVVSGAESFTVVRWRQAS